jgi:hypothetical protein
MAAPEILLLVLVVAAPLGAMLLVVRLLTVRRASRRSRDRPAAPSARDGGLERRLRERPTSPERRG